MTRSCFTTEYGTYDMGAFLKIIIQEVMKVLQSEVLQRKLEQISEEKGIEEILNFHQ